MKKLFLIKIVVFFLFSMLICPAYAQQDQTKQYQQSQETEQQKPAKKKSIKKNAAKPFIPSEKISADSSVSFPVDI